MLRRSVFVTSCLLLCLLVLTFCDVGEPGAGPLPTPLTGLDVIPIYPGEAVQLEMGWSPRFTVRVSTTQAGAVENANVAVTIKDPAGETVADLVAVHRGEGIYHTERWTVPPRSQEGTWMLVVEATAGGVQGRCTRHFQVKSSLSEILLAKYGFWLDGPNLCAEPRILEERGDVRNGWIRWGGSVGGMHIVPSNYVHIHWREGEFGLQDAGAATRFLLEEVGDLGDVRGIGSAEPLTFKQWPAWRLECKTYSWEEMEWVLFYVPEVDKTYAIATVLTLPPSVPCPHCRLRDSFATFPEIPAGGVAPEPLLRLLPGPELIAPSVGARFQGLEPPIVLRWEPVKMLADDEYYQVEVDYFYREKRTFVSLYTRETQVALPEALYRSPNCTVFNWRVRLKRQRGVEQDGQPEGEVLSHPSLYRYLRWLYPPGAERGFPVLCSYAHYD
jgi:hypothetical protein